MKLIIVLLTFMVFSHQQKKEDQVFDQKLKLVIPRCMKDFKIEEIPDVLPEEHEPECSHDLQCFIKCVHVKMGLMNEDGAVIEKEMIKQLQPTNETEAFEIMKMCKQPVNSDSCENAYKFSKCTADVARELGNQSE